jgi:hypothetical protein
MPRVPEIALRILSGYATLRPSKNYNVVRMPIPGDSRDLHTPRAGDAIHDPRVGDATPLAAAGSDDDPVMREALRLIQAFLAIEDANARNALVTLAESLVSYDWVRKAQRR